MHLLIATLVLSISHLPHWLHFLAGSGILFGMALTPSIKHTWTKSIKNDSGAAVVADPPLVVIGTAEHNFEVQVPAGETDEIDMPVTVSKIVSAFVSSTQPGTISTNAADGTGGQVITFTAPTKAVTWNNTEITACPFTPNITKFFCHNTGTTTATFRGGFLLSE